MKRGQHAFILVATAALAACATTSGPREEVMAEAEQKINEFCYLKNPPEPPKENRIKRAKIVLAAVAGYGYRSVQNYSLLSDIGRDANAIVSKLNAAYEQIGVMNEQKESGLFLVYRADTIVGLTEAAGAAIAPTLRAAKRSLVAASVSERLMTAKNALIGLLEDELYLSAYKTACQDFAQISDADVTARIKGRCEALSDLSKLVGAGPTACAMN